MFPTKKPIKLFNPINQDKDETNNLIFILNEWMSGTLSTHSSEINKHISSRIEQAQARSQCST